MPILINYVNSILVPTDHQEKFIKSTVKSIKRVLTHNSPIAPKEIHSGGSFSKGTMLRHNLDIDLVFIYNKSEEIEGNWQKLSNILYKVLKENFLEIEIKEAGNLAIHLKKSLDNQLVNFDIVPCYYVNSPKMMEEHITSKLYTGITTIWHTRFLIRYKNLPYFTSVVRLLKDWKEEHNIPLKSIHLELLTADVYENILKDKNEPGEIEEILMCCYENIIDTLDGYPVLPTNWRYCNVNNFEERYNEPVLIDPANIYDNLLKEKSKAEIKIIRKKTNITIENLRENNFNDIFNWKRKINYFD